MARFIDYIRLHDPRHARGLTPLDRSDGGLSACTVIEPTRRVTWQSPQIAGGQEMIGGGRIDVDQPALELREWQDAAPLAGSDFIFPDRQPLAFHPIDFDGTRDMPMAERFGAIRIAGGKVFARPAKAPPRGSGAISLLGQCSGNYAHFLTEVLPRLALVDRFPEYSNLPLLLDDWMPHDNHFALVDMFSRYERNIVRVNMRRPFSLKRLITLSPTAHACPESRAWITDGKVVSLPGGTYKFSITALNALRELALKRTRGSFGRRLFLWRRAPAYGNCRQLSNMWAIAEIARRAGFTIIEPMSMSADEQVKAFRDARVVIAPSGAALANLVFTPPGCSVICLAASFPGAEYYYFSNLMQALGHDIRFVIGPRQADYAGHPAHGDFTIDASLFAACLDGAISQQAA